jgi:hypothetical protein
VTGVFLLVTVASWGLSSAGATAHLVLLPAPPDAIEIGCDACLCDMNGVVAGVDIGTDGGCAAERKLQDWLTVMDESASERVGLISLCPVPNDCIDAGVHNATAALQAIDGRWSQPGGFSWRACTIGDPASDECDPSTDAARDNALAFVTVFGVQCCAIALGHVVMMWKLRRMVADNRRRRRRAMADPRLEQRARRFVADAKVQKERERNKGDGGPKLSARARFRRAGIVAKFSARAMKAAHEAPEVESVDDVVLEISEAVAAHWHESLSYFVAAGTAAMAVTFVVAGFVVSAQTG